MIKQLKEWGAGLAIYFESKEVELLNLKAGDEIDLSDIFKIKTYKKLPKNQTMKMIKDEVRKC